MLLLLIVVEASTVLATSSLGGKVRYADTLVVPATETVDSDLYVFGGTVTMDGSVHGDLVVAGGNVQVGGKVDGDVIVGGGTVVLSGPVGGAIRAGAGQLTISGDVKRDVLAGSGTLLITSGAHVGGDLIFAAGQTTLNGDIAGSIQGQATTYARSGAVGGTENVTINPTSASVAAPVATPEGIVLGALRHFIVVLLFGALALWLMPRGLRAADEVVRRRPLPALGSGLLALVGYTVLIVALLVVMVVLAIAFGLLTLGSLVAVDVVTWLLGYGRRDPGLHPGRGVHRRWRRGPGPGAPRAAERHGRALAGAGGPRRGRGGRGRRDVRAADRPLGEARGRVARAGRPGDGGLDVLEGSPWRAASTGPLPVLPVARR